MNKKVIFTLTAVLVLFFMISSVSAENMLDFFNSDEANQTNTEDNLIIGFNAQFPPFGYKDANGEYTGFDIELAKEVCKRNNWTLKLQPVIDWTSKKLELDSGEIDCIWSEFTIDGRENDYTWSEPYFKNTPYIIVKSDSNINTNNATLNNTYNEIVEVDGYNTALMDLNSGVCDGIVVDSGLANYLAIENKDLKLLNKSIAQENYGIGFKKGNIELRDQVQKTIDEMFKDGTVDKIAQNYSEYGIPEGVIHP